MAVGLRDADMCETALQSMYFCMHHMLPARQTANQTAGLTWLHVALAGARTVSAALHDAIRAWREEPNQVSICVHDHRTSVRLGERAVSKACDELPLVSTETTTDSACTAEHRNCSLYMHAVAAVAGKRITQSCSTTSAEEHDRTAECPPSTTLRWHCYLVEATNLHTCSQTSQQSNTATQR
jgi:hypothetical protein